MLLNSAVSEIIYTLFNILLCLNRNIKVDYTLSQFLIPLLRLIDCEFEFLTKGLMNL